IYSPPCEAGTERWTLMKSTNSRTVTSRASTGRVRGPARTSVNGSGPCSCWSRVPRTTRSRDSKPRSAMKRVCGVTTPSCSQSPASPSASLRTSARIRGSAGMALPFSSAEYSLRELAQAGPGPDRPGQDGQRHCQAIGLGHGHHRYRGNIVRPTPPHDGSAVRVSRHLDVGGQEPHRVLDLEQVLDRFLDRGPGGEPVKAPVLRQVECLESAALRR